MSVERVGQVYYRVDDMDRAVAFYEKALGLRLKFRDGNAWAAFDGGGTTFALEGGGAPRSRQPLEGSPGGAIVAFRVTNLDELVHRLAASGNASGQEILEGAHERRIELLDPSGNRFMLYEPREQPA